LDLICTVFVGRQKQQQQHNELQEKSIAKNDRCKLQLFMSDWLSILTKTDGPQMGASKRETLELCCSTRYCMHPPTSRSSFRRPPIEIIVDVADVDVLYGTVWLFLSFKKRLLF
jgi:hypothetical protein